jgi:lactate dehydrogenase-like 2-hydroxyacid dehydrogenase
LHDRLHEGDPAAFEALAPRIRAIAASGESRVGAELIARLPALELISVMGVGYDGVDVAAAKARGVVVTHTPDVLNDEVADTAIGLMLCAARQLPAADRFVRAGEWAKGPMPLQRKMRARAWAWSAWAASARPSRSGPRPSACDRLHRAQRQARAALPSCPRRRRWPPRATSWSSSRPAAPARAS